MSTLVRGSATLEAWSPSLLRYVDLIVDSSGNLAVSATGAGAGSATEATLLGVLTTTAFQARINTLGQKTMANSTPVTLASDQSAIDVNAAVTKLSLSYASGSASSSGNNTLLTPAAGKKIRVYYASYNPSAATEVAFRFGAAGTLFLRNSIVTAGSIVAKDVGDARYVEGAANEALIMNLTNAVATIWNVFYVEL